MPACRLERWQERQLMLFSPNKSGSLILLAMLAATPLVIAREDNKPNSSKSTSGSKTKSSVVTSEAGLNIPDMGVAIDAVYDERLDNLIKGYKILNIVVSNRGSKEIYLDVSDDKWKIVDSFDKKHTAYNHVRQFDSKLWDVLPNNFKKKIDYPQVIKPGKTTTVDVFFPASVQLTNFREIIWKSKHFDKEFNIFSNYEKILDVGGNDEKSFDTPKSDTIKWDKKGDLKSKDEILNFRENESTTTTDSAAGTETDANRRIPNFDDAIIMDPAPQQNNDTGSTDEEFTN